MVSGPMISDLIVSGSNSSIALVNTGVAPIGMVHSGLAHIGLAPTGLGQISDSILTPATFLWLIAALVAATLVFGAINRRRNRLTDSLKEYVDENKMTTETMPTRRPSDPSEKDD